MEEPEKGYTKDKPKLIGKMIMDMWSILQTNMRFVQKMINWKLQLQEIE